MSHLFVTQSASSGISQPREPCCDQKWWKITLVVLGVLLIGGCVASHLCNVNAIAVYTMGGVGGACILGALLAAVVQYNSHIRSAIREKEAEREEIQAQLIKLENEQNWHALASNGDVAAIQQGLKDGVLPDLTGLLEGASFNGHAELVSLLLTNGADPMRLKENNFLGYTALHNAVICHTPVKGLETMQILLAKDPTLATVKSKRRQATPLHLAALPGISEDQKIHREKVELLIKNGADVNATDIEQSTPLHEAMQGFLRDPNIEVIELLVKAGARLDVVDKSGRTPLYIAQTHSTWYNNPEINSRLATLQK